MRIVLMGPPGAGKGTQATRLVEKFGMTHLSSGDIFRAEKASGSELGNKLADIIDRGELVPDDIVVEMMAKAITAVEGGLLLDGFPRTVAQAKALDDTLAGMGEKLDAIILIVADEDAIVERICARRKCPTCGKDYNIKFIPSAKGEYCDVCPGDVKLAIRDDDNEDVVRARMVNYRNQTEPVISYYKDAGKVKVVEINGNQGLDQVAGDIANAMETLKS